MRPLKIMTAILLMLTMALSVSPIVFAGEIDCDGFYFDYDDELMIYPNYKKVVEEMKKYAKKGDLDTVTELNSELIRISSKYTQLKFYAEIPARDELITFAVCEFDKDTGAVLKVINDGALLYIPAYIDNVLVTHIAEGAVEDKKELSTLFVPPTVDVIDSVIVKNCPKFNYLHNLNIPLTTTFFENCPSYNGENVFIDNNSTITHISNSATLRTSYITTTLGMGFAVDSGIIRGDEHNKYNWYDNLTRTEAVIMILRLMGLDDEASAYQDKPCQFTDVPSWAKGYVNLAVENGIVKGISETTFGSTNPCNARDFLTMLFRLTDLSEGKDYSWNTIIEDYALRLKEIDKKRGKWNSNNSNSLIFFNPGLKFREYADDFSNHYYMGGRFTRFIAADSLYFMLHIIAGEDERSFGDILAYKYNMDDILLYNYYVRRSAFNLKTKSSDIPYTYLHSLADHDKLLPHLRNTYPLVDPSEIDPEVAAMAKSIAANEKNEYDKVKAVSKWVAEHIFYDLDLLSKTAPGYTDAANVFKHRRSVCEGYADLTNAMLRSIGVESYTLTSLDHAWNVAVIDNKIILVDSTFDSPLQYSSGEYTYKHKKAENIMEPGAIWEPACFDSTPEEFYRSSSHQISRTVRYMQYNFEDEEKYLEKQRRQQSNTGSTTTITNVPTITIGPVIKIN